jgi:hypothetical protein
LLSFFHNDQAIDKGANVTMKRTPEQANLALTHGGFPL